MAAEGSREVGGSLPVPNVQEVASLNPKDIPHRYIRPTLSVDFSVDQSLQIPVLDLTRLCSDHPSQELAKLHQACKEWGFFQLINHGAAQVIEEMKTATEEFFKLPLSEKMKSAQQPNNIEGYGQAFVVSEDQKLDWGDMLFLMSLPVPLRNMQFWPQNPPNFRATIDKYSKEVQKIAMMVVSLMETNLGIEAQKLTRAFEDCNQGIRMNYYPPCTQAEKVMGLTAHSDATGLTLLLQLNQVQGLQINIHGKWVPIQPLAAAIVVNIGDIMEIMSNGEYRSIEHRAVVNTKKERLSIAAFHSPNIDTSIGPFSDLTKTTCEKYKRLTHKEYVTLVVNTKLDGKSLLDQLKLTH
ncbi:hypothetical protein C2S52_002968 [Perilla frutescens var. hirtella]|nr:hypothetical protein C2S52_002968 [Perilla frutescens var. hirtella]